MADTQYTYFRECQLSLFFRWSTKSTRMAPINPVIEQYLTKRDMYIEYVYVINVWLFQ